MKDFYVTYHDLGGYHWEVFNNYDAAHRCVDPTYIIAVLPVKAKDKKDAVKVAKELYSQKFYS